MTKQEIFNLQKDFEELKAHLIKETVKQQTEENNSNNSEYLDTSEEGSILKSSAKKQANGYLNASQEFFFGDLVIN